MSIIDRDSINIAKLHALIGESRKGKEESGKEKGKKAAVQENHGSSLVL
jgi:hypothetical protein